jgi:hydroxymethylglutaryl-CoA reductase (NADPH)
MIGELTVPLSVVGPLKVKGLTQDWWVPLSTTEGALVASVQRGVKAVGQAGGAVSEAEDRGMTRAPVFKVAGIREGQKLKQWLEVHAGEIKKAAEATSNHLKLIGVETEQAGGNVWVRLRYLTGEAMGMNMVTIATQKVVELIERQVKIRCIALSGNGCVDKKAAWSNVILGRGLRLQAEIRVPEKVVKETLKTTSKAIVEVVTRKDWLGAAMTGSMGFNGHFANIVAALFLATGQDMAHVVEGSLGMTTAELRAKNLYFSITLPDVVIGTVGGGTNLPVQKAALGIMGLGKGLEGEKLILGRILGATILAGELSLTAALAAGHLAGAHARLGRGRI